MNINLNCYCGCGTPTNHPSSTFRPGHDARFAGQIARAIVATPADREALLARVPSTPLLFKIQTMESNLQAKAARKTAKGRVPSQAVIDATKAVRVIEAPTEAQKAEGAAADPTQGIVKVGRWEYPGYMDSTGRVQRNDRRDGSGSWIPAPAANFTAN